MLLIVINGHYFIFYKMPPIKQINNTYIKL